MKNFNYIITLHVHTMCMYYYMCVMKIYITNTTHVSIKNNKFYFNQQQIILKITTRFSTTDHVIRTRRRNGSVPGGCCWTDKRQ